MQGKTRHYHSHSLAEDAGFQVFVSLDQGIEFQQNLTGRNIAVILLRAKSNRLADLIPLAGKILMSLSSIEPGLLVRIQ